MTDKTTPQKTNDVNQEDIEDTNINDGKESGQDIFDAKFHRLMDIFGRTCEEEGIEVAVAIAMYPELPPEDMEKLVNEQGQSPLHPMVFYRGHMADVAALQASVLRGMKAELMHALRTD